MPKSSSAAQKKKRLVQLRDAQRRRRARLRDDKQHFVQIILPETTLAELSRLIEESGETMQQAIARLVQSALNAEPVTGEELETAEAVEAVEIERIAEIADEITPEPTESAAPTLVEVEEVLEIIEETRRETEAGDEVEIPSQITAGQEEHFPIETAPDDDHEEAKKPALAEAKSAPDGPKPDAPAHLGGQLDLFG